MHSTPPITWHDLGTGEGPSAAVSTRRRMRGVLLLFTVLIVAILARAAQLEVRHGDDFRIEALKPLRREIVLPAARGRILARDGTVLASDRQLLALSVHYRYLQHEPDPVWIRTQARQRLPKADRRNRERVAQEEIELRQEIADQQQRLAELCGLSFEAWQARTSRIEQRIEALAVTVNERREERFAERQAKRMAEEASDDSPWWNLAANLPDALRALASPDEEVLEPVIVVEQVDFHIVVEDLPVTVAEQIRTQAERYPGVRVVDVQRRTYPGTSLAANLLGHLGRNEAASDKEASKRSTKQPPLIGLLGLERSRESQLGGQDGAAIEETDRRGRLLATHVTSTPLNGNDITLTLNPALQASSEALIDRAIERNPQARGGALVLLDVSNGDVLALASTPRFNPNDFALHNTDEVARTLADPGEPLFDRATRMALPPGGLFKPYAAVAMLESMKVPAQAHFHCQGYLHDPESLRCAIFRQQGIGHGDLTLAEALAQNCSVYFLHYAGVIGVEPLVQMATKFGFGSPTGIELPSESAGAIPQPGPVTARNKTGWRSGEAQLLSIGQGSLAVTPLQMARAMAMIANGGKSVLPRLVASHDSTEPASGNPDSLRFVQAALERAVSHTSGASHESLSLESISLAGLAASGEVAGDAPDHAWCAGYVPASAPRYAFAIAIEHGGEGAQAAAPLAKRLIQRMLHLGLLSRSAAPIARSVREPSPVLPASSVDETDSRERPND